MALGLGQDISIRPAALEFVADAAVEVVLVPGVHPEREKALEELVVHELGDGAMEAAHHGSEVAPDFEVSQDVIVIGEQRSHEGDESVFLRVVIEAIPEDVFAGLGKEKGSLLALSLPLPCSALVR
jgi:hypothetical protein